MSVINLKTQSLHVILLAGMVMGSRGLPRQTRIAVAEPLLSSILLYEAGSWNSLSKGACETMQSVQMRKVQNGREQDRQRSTQTRGWEQLADENGARAPDVRGKIQERMLPKHTIHCCSQTSRVPSCGSGTLMAHSERNQANCVSCHALRFKRSLWSRCGTSFRQIGVSM